MKIICYILFCSIVSLSNCLYSSPINNIDKDPFLRTWLFVGPFNDFEAAKLASNTLSNATTEDIINYVESNENIEKHLFRNK